MTKRASSDGTARRLADAMPEITEWVASLREAFGNEMMDDIIRRGRNGEPVFYAYENGIEFGTRLPESENAWRLEGFPDRFLCCRCGGRCVKTKTECTGTWSSE